MKKKQNHARDYGFYLLILIILLATVYLMLQDSNQTERLQYSQMQQLFENEQVKSFTIDGNNVLKMELYSEYEGKKTVSHKLRSLDLFYQDMGELIKEQRKTGVLTVNDYEPPQEASVWVMMLPYLLPIGILVVFWIVMFRSYKKSGGAGGGGAIRFGKARVRLGTDESKKVTFADVAGCDEEKEELEEVVEFLKNPATFNEIGARIPKGVLLVGPPGTGKTLLAKAVAGEAGVQFLSISGSDFVELYVGVGASRVRDLFSEAKKIAPAIVFIDEIDAVGRQRGSGLGGGHDEREQTLNQLLVEMDGFGNNSGVIVIAATNRADILDNALLRPGRFDRTVYVGLPDKKGREEILKIHARGKALGDDVDLNSIARGTPGFSGADLENLLNEAAILAVRSSRRFISSADVEEAIRKVQMGPEKKSKKMSDRARKLAAYHESGHAIAGKFLEHTDPVHYITIIPRGPSGGATYFRPQEDEEDFKSYNELYEKIIVCLGGRIAEAIFLDDISTGAASDIQQATSIARSMITQYGMSSKLGPISYDSSGHSIFIGRDFGTTKSYSEETAAIIDEEVKRLFDEASAKCESILREHRDLLVTLAEYLLEHETMEGEDFHYLCEHGELPPVKDETIEPPAKVISYNNEPPAIPGPENTEPESEDEAGAEEAAPETSGEAEEQAAKAPESEPENDENGK